MTANCANYANVAALPLVIGHLPLKNELAGTGMAKLVRAGRGRNGQDGGEAPAMRVGPMVLPLILWFVSHQGEIAAYGKISYAESSISTKSNEQGEVLMVSSLAMTRSGR